MKNLKYAFSLLLLASCTTLSPTGGGLRKFDPGAKQECIEICKKVDMPFQAIVVVGGMAGCVCQQKGAASASSPGVMGGAVAALIAQQQQQQQQQQAGGR